MIAGVVLAAGTSSRLGRPKQLLDLEGRPVLQHVVDAVCSAGLDDVVIVLGHAAEDIQARLALPPGARTVINSDYTQGQSTSLRAGLHAMSPDAEAAVIVLGDQPRLTPDVLRRVLVEWRAAGAPVLRPLFRGSPGHPVVAGRAAWEAFMRASGDEGARSVMAGAEVAEVELGLDPLEDIDTWDDFRSVRQAPPLKGDK
jgi:molybdenum cofactor cytidylyltransferase